MSVKRRRSYCVHPGTVHCQSQSQGLQGQSREGSSALTPAEHEATSALSGLCSPVPQGWGCVCVGGVKKGEEGKKGAGALVPAEETIPWGFLEFLGMKDVSGSPWLPRAGPEDTLSFWTPSSLDRVEVG